MLDDDVDAADGGAHARLQDLFGELFFVEGDHFLDVAHAAAQVFAEADDLANHDRRARDGLHHAVLAALDALGDLDLALAGEQRDGAHLAQVHADGVVGLLQRAGREVELDVLGLFAGLGLILVAVRACAFAGEHVDALGVDGGHQVIELVGRGDVAGQQVVDLAIGEIALLFSGVDELLYDLLRTCRFLQPRRCALLRVKIFWGRQGYRRIPFPWLFRGVPGVGCGVDRGGKPDRPKGRSGHSKAHVPSGY